jgi:1,4-dihydroxy-2-naphthoate octaprenyltransferase
VTIRPWLVAARPPTLLASVAPVLAGSGLAAGDGVFRWDVFVVTLVTAVLLNIAVNFANDASDARRGADTPDRIGPPRAVATGLLTARQVWAGTWVVLALAAAGGVYLTAVAGWVVVAIGSTAIAAALAYTGGPWPYGYRALGEVFVFVYFGLAAVVGSRYVHDGTAPASAWWLAVPVGLLVTAILVANNVRDIDTDRNSGKRTLAVVLGRGATRRLFVGLIAAAFGIVAAAAALDLVPRGTLLALAAAPLAVRPVRTVLGEEAGPALIAALKGTALLHFAFGALVGVGAAL